MTSKIFEVNGTVEGNCGHLEVMYKFLLPLLKSVICYQLLSTVQIFKKN